MPRYKPQRSKVAPPLVPLRALRSSHGLSQEQVCQQVTAITNKTFTKGALSAIENGLRGASAETLAALELTFRMPPGTFVIGYQPSHDRRPTKVEDIPA